MFRGAGPATPEQNRACRYDLSYKYILGHALGEGVSADVYKATCILTDEEVAIKVFKDATSAGTHAAATEYLCAMRAAGAYALEYHSVAFMNGKPALVMDLASMSLDKWIKVLLYYRACCCPVALACDTRRRNVGITLPCCCPSTNGPSTQSFHSTANVMLCPDV